MTGPSRFCGNCSRNQEGFAKHGVGLDYQHFT